VTDEEIIEAIFLLADEEIIEAIFLLAKTEGIFTETAGGVTVAGLKRLAKEGCIDSDETVVVYITGNGLKTPDVGTEAYAIV